VGNFLFSTSILFIASRKFLSALHRIQSKVTVRGNDPDDHGANGGSGQARSGPSSIPDFTTDFFGEKNHALVIIMSVH